MHIPRAGVRWLGWCVSLLGLAVAPEAVSVSRWGAVGRVWSPCGRRPPLVVSLFVFPMHLSCCGPPTCVMRLMLLVLSPFLLSGLCPPRW